MHFVTTGITEVSVVPCDRKSNYHEDSQGMVRINPKMKKVLSVQYRFDDEVKDDTHGVFTSEKLKLPQTTWSLGS
jgi:hypothetical protein